MKSEEEIFTPFRPYCAYLASEPNAECLNKLGKLCAKAETQDLEVIQEYLVFPAQLHLKEKARTTPQNYTISILDYIQTLYKRIRLSSLFLFRDLLSSCLALVSVKNDNSVRVNEDLQISICDTVRQLVTSSLRGEAGGVIFSELASTDHDLKLPLSHLIYTSLSWASEDTAPASVRLSCLSLLTSLCPPASPHSPQLASLYSSMLPGMTSKLARLIQTSKVSQASVTAAAISCWSTYVSLVLEDSNFNIPNDPSQLSLTPIKDDKWLKEASNQVSNIVSISTLFD